MGKKRRKNNINTNNKRKEKLTLNEKWILRFSIIELVLSIVALFQSCESNNIAKKANQQLELWNR